LSRFEAPWGRTLKLVSALAVAVCFGITASLGPVISSAGPASIHFWGGLLPVIILALAALFTVRGYRICGDSLQVERLFWRTCVRLEGLEEAHPTRVALNRSVRLFGNSGLFGFTGLFRHPELGVFRAFVTDWEHALVLRWPDRLLVVSPDEPEAFMDALRNR